MNAPTSPADIGRRVRYHGDTGTIERFPTPDNHRTYHGKAVVLLDGSGWARVHPSELELIDDDQEVTACASSASTATPDAGGLCGAPGARLRPTRRWPMPENARPGGDSAVQVCQAHGRPDDLVVCPYRRCQGGRVPLWTGYGTPAGSRPCVVCDGHGRITRAEAKQKRARLHGDDTWQPFCICWALGTDHV